MIEEEKKNAVATRRRSSNGQLDAGALLNALVAVKDGDFTTRLPLDWTGVNGKIADAFNEIVAQEEKFAQEIERASRIVGQEGKLSHRIAMGRVSGGWSAKVDALNNLIADTAWPV